MGQLRELISALDATGLHFVRCIKPNTQLMPGSFDAPMTLHQLRCCGVLEVARVAAAGFPTRYTHAQFALRYAILLPAEEQQQLASGGEMLKVSCAALRGTGIWKLVECVGRRCAGVRPTPGGNPACAWP